MFSIRLSTSSRRWAVGSGFPAMNLTFATSVPFRGARLKIERADTHIKDLDLVVQRFFERNPYQIFFHEDASGMQGPACRVSEVPPADWGLIIGDAVHNLRSALDVLANDLAKPERHGEARFPIFADQAGWAKAIKDMKRTTPDDVLAKLEALQPYNGGDRRLRDLHLLNIQDKHKVIIPALGVVAVYNVSGRQRGTGGTISVGEMSISPTEPGIYPLGLQTHRSTGIEYNPNLQASGHIEFGNSDALKRSPVLPSLQSMRDAVVKVIDDFTPAEPTYIGIG